MLEVEKIDTFYDEFQVLREASISIKERELVVLFGPNGHGKSTLLKSICGLLTPASGSIKYNDVEITKLTTKKIVEMGITYVAEERNLFPQLTVLENLKLGAYNVNARKKEQENLAYVFELFPQLKDRINQSASTLSGGEARMLAMGRGLMSNALFLAVDEPSLGLAPNLRIEVLNQISDINQRGVAILLVEQSSPKALDIADRIYLMEEGEIVFQGTKEEVLQGNHFKEAFLGM
jgi:branched-chain amino acid transport system ATP-binding protein